MKKKLFGIFGPILLAAVLLLLLFFSPVRKNTSDPALLKEASSSMSGNVLRGNDIKRGAIRTGQYVPFFGSSELSRISPFHPSVLAEKYHRGYTPFLMGAPGTQSLTQFMMMQSLGSEIKDKKAVFVISPQWFVKDGINRDYFDAYYSPEQTLNWVLDLKKVEASDQYLAGRLLSYGVVNKDDRLARMLDNIKEGKLPDKEDLRISQLKYNMLSREDELFSTIGMRSKQESIDKSTKALPDKYDLATLDQLADQIGRKATRGNNFEIQHHFFKQRIQPQLKQMEGSQKNWDYRYSTEFSDFQLALDQLAKEHTDCLFIIPPVNGRWAAYTGLSQPMLEQFAHKIKYQLNSQGFNNVVDMTDKANVPYFMQDTIHLGWKGWLTADQSIQPFLENKQPVEVNYQINNKKFLSTEWQKTDPNKLPE
ncbi:D-alanyl-lipoteichoic acid biosynthesis protein DltD [Enterococcus pallens]|uniref:Protein DltD n=1 Tax=Enterococcus pallens ATCC BAA-351 TaxID=1158607 RepID=R2SRM9_9ENTE|nr:D-alanyl-lipoteichoic acid biosynthesis protein DltD [Enterococcus pallens]EOH97920.1 D-alanyl-lipoteichoic acid biosynthesis protein DltD [Enterococcus pallens ATCC BAA-351]EOU20661.1 D-alanyl-lipoteichoic acid biosynthesis protein DltD [Enterococcus pallens ATCC BAA-351]OJG79383.1 D-alanyl-lipoteichoic acid biosynthesis protein DltD [Enterococcus pallens]